MKITHAQARIGLAHLNRQEALGIRRPVHIGDSLDCPCVGGAMIGVKHANGHTQTIMDIGFYRLETAYEDWAQDKEGVQPLLSDATFADVRAFLKSVLATPEPA